jgi:hypothetical protein
MKSSETTFVPRSAEYLPMEAPNVLDSDTEEMEKEWGNFLKW